MGRSAGGAEDAGPGGLWHLGILAFFIGNLLVRIHFIIGMIRWTGLAPWEFEFPFPGSLTSTFLLQVEPKTPDLEDSGISADVVSSLNTSRF